jgi:hypothetical protein
MKLTKVVSGALDAKSTQKPKIVALKVSRNKRAHGAKEIQITAGQTYTISVINALVGLNGEKYLLLAYRIKVYKSWGPWTSTPKVPYNCSTKCSDCLAQAVPIATFYCGTPDLSFWIELDFFDPLGPTHHQVQHQIFSNCSAWQSLVICAK